MTHVFENPDPRFFRLKVGSSVSFKTIPQWFVMVEAQSRANHREMRERLRKVANLQPGFGVVFFAEKAEIVTQCEQTVKQGVRFCDSTLQLVHVGEPKTAREKDPFPSRQTIRAALGSVAQHQTVRNQFALNGGDRSSNARIINWQEP